MKCNRNIRVFAALALVLSLFCPACGSMHGQRPAQPEKKEVRSKIIVKKSFSPKLASIVRQYRHLVVKEGLWRKSGKATVKAAPIHRTTSTKAGVVPLPSPVPASKSGDSNITYQVTVKMTDVSRSDGSQTITQTIVVTGDDGSRYSDVITHSRDAGGNTTETQDVSSTDPDGKTTTESSFSESGPGGGDDPCFGLFCGAYERCCTECPKSPQCGIE